MWRAWMFFELRFVEQYKPTAAAKRVAADRRFGGVDVSTVFRDYKRHSQRVCESAEKEYGNEIDSSSWGRDYKRHIIRLADEAEQAAAASKEARRLKLIDLGEEFSKRFPDLVPKALAPFLDLHERTAEKLDELGQYSKAAMVINYLDEQKRLEILGWTYLSIIRAIGNNTGS